MLDPRREAVLIRDRETGEFRDRTGDVSRYQLQNANGLVVIVFNGGRPYSYGPANVRILGNPQQVALVSGIRVEVSGAIWNSATEVVTFIAPEGAWSRIFYDTRTEGEKCSTHPASQVRIVASATQDGAACDVMGYWRAIVSRLPGGDALRRPFDRLGFVHPESVLGSYLMGTPIARREEPTASPIFPFRCNLSQRTAVEYGLTHSVSVIEGPPGTGKTETILNLIANIVAGRGGTVGVVSYANSAVDNVREKLDELGFGHMIANLGRREKRDEFLAGQPARNARADQFAGHAPGPPSPERRAEVDRRLRRLQDAERTRAELRQEVDAHRLELRHFERHLERDEVPELAGLPLLRRSADRILDYLAESELEHAGARPGLPRRILRYFRYGSLRGLDPGDTNVVLRLQRAYYDRRIAELDRDIERFEDELRRADFDRLAEEHRQLSLQVLRAELGSRYDKRARTAYRGDIFWKGQAFRDFAADYSVLLSTCHALRDCIPEGQLLDYLVIDEASQVNPLLAALVLSCCRNLVVVGDLQQLPPIPLDEAADIDPPRDPYDVREHSILSSLVELYGGDLPRTLLREHYRCDPAIIGFCNKSFYKDELIPYKTGGEMRPMIVAPTSEGNHMRQHRGRGRSNQRELDVIKAEVIPEYCADIPDTDIGVTTPYRLQADKAADMLDEGAADTIHRFQGRQKKAVILTTVLDETRRGRAGLKFVDDPKKINVAVSRAIQRFILVTNHDMMPSSRHVRDLRDYICYQNPDDEIAVSEVISIFDLLYKKYSERLQPLAARLKGDVTYKSEEVTWITLRDILAEEPYAHLAASHQVLLRNLLPSLTNLTPRQLTFVRHRASVDFVIYNRVTNHPVLAIEVDGFKYHENNPAQLKRDEVKNEILRAHQLRLLRLPTTGSAEEQRIRNALDDAEDEWAHLSR